MTSPTACGALFSARTTLQPSQNLVEPLWNWWNPGGTLVEPSWNLTSRPPRTTPQPIWAETPKLSAVEEKTMSKQMHIPRRLPLNGSSKATVLKAITSTDIPQDSWCPSRFWRVSPCICRRNEAPATLSGAQAGQRHMKHQPSLLLILRPKTRVPFASNGGKSLSPTTGAERGVLLLKDQTSPCAVYVKNMC